MPDSKVTKWNIALVLSALVLSAVVFLGMFVYSTWADNKDIQLRDSYKAKIDSLENIVKLKQHDIDSLVKLQNRVDTLIVSSQHNTQSIILKREATVQKLGTLGMPDLAKAFKLQLDSAAY